jgi:hypothetical protein
VDPFALPCHPSLRVDGADRDWRAVGVKTTDGVRRKSTRCPECKSTWTAFERVFAEGLTTVEWVQSVPFRVCAVALPDDRRDVPLWQDAQGRPVAGAALPDPDAQAAALADLQGQTAAFEDWSRSAQLVTVVQAVTAGGQVFAEPGELLLERRERWNPQDRRLALLWSPRVQRPVVAWHSFARLLQG